MSIIHALSNNGYILVNKKLAKNLGLQTAVLIGELCAEYEYWESLGKLQDGYFYSTQKNIEENTTIGESQQKRIVDKLEELGILQTKREGLPAKKYYKFNEKILLQYLEDSTINSTEFAEDSSVKPGKLHTPNMGINNNKLNNNKEKENNTISKDIVFAESEISLSEDVVDKLYNNGEDVIAKKSKKKNLENGENKRKNLYEKCVDEINDFTDLPDLREVLIEYLKFRISIKDKPLYSIAQWRSMLKKLDSAVEECMRQYVDVVQQSIDKAWLNFYPIKDAYGKSNKKETVTADLGEVHSSMYKSEDEGVLSDVQF